MVRCTGWPSPHRIHPAGRRARDTTRCTYPTARFRADRTPPPPRTTSGSTPTTWRPGSPVRLPPVCLGRSLLRAEVVAAVGRAHPEAVCAVVWPPTQRPGRPFPARACAAGWLDPCEARCSGRSCCATCGTPWPCGCTRRWATRCTTRSRPTGADHRATLVLTVRGTPRQRTEYPVARLYPDPVRGGARRAHKS